MTLDAAEVAHLARLARIRISPEEAEALSRDARAILEGFHHIESALAAHAPEGSEGAPALVPREDVVVAAPAEERAGIVRAFPARTGDHCKVPRSAP